MTYWAVLLAWGRMDVEEFRQRRWDYVAYAARYGKSPEFAVGLDISALEEFCAAIDKLIKGENRTD